MVKLALISDIHGNYKALEAFLDYLGRHPADGVICLGDYVTDGPYPERTMELIYGMTEKYICYMVRGNREEYLLNNKGNRQGWKPSSVNGALYYTYQHITERDLDFFASLPGEREVRIEGCPALYICHGTPGRLRGNVREETGLKEEAMRALPCDYLLGGHSHHQETDIIDGKTYINPGSLGFAIDGTGRQGQFALLTGTEKGWETEFFSIPYDVEAYLKDFGESGVDEMGMMLNRAVKKSLVTGINYFYDSIQAMEEEAGRAGLASLADLPEEAWEKLAEKFGL